MTDSQDWWPADWGHYGGLMIRLAWHAAGSYRLGRWPRWRRHRQHALRAAEFLAGQRQPGQGAPPAVAGEEEIRQRSLSWADLIILAGTMAYEIDGAENLWIRLWPRGHLGPGKGHQLGRRKRMAGTSRRRAMAISRSRTRMYNPLAAVHMGLIYVNPEGVNGKPDPLKTAHARARDLCPHGDERRGNRGPDRWRPHRWQVPRQRRRRARSARTRRRATSSSRALAGATRSDGKASTTPSPRGIEGAWTTHPTKWDNGYLTCCSNTNGS